MSTKTDPYKLQNMDNVKVEFARFNGGVIIRDEGYAVGINNNYLAVELNDGTKVYFRRKNGWGIGKSKYWRLNFYEREKYVHVDQPSGSKLRFRSS